jgi:hypothetical protein
VGRPILRRRKDGANDLREMEVRILRQKTKSKDELLSVV